MNINDEARILREELAKTRIDFLRFAAAQHSWASDCKRMGDDAGMREHCAVRNAYQSAAQQISATLARVTRRMRKETPNHQLGGSRSESVASPR